MVRWFRFFRWPNLLIIALTMFMVRHLVIAPHLAEPGLFALHSLFFGFLVAATVLIAAAGYVVNDIVDQEIDAANKPERVFVGRYLAESAAWKLFGGLNGVAFLFFAGLIWGAGFSSWMLVIPMSAGLLVAYAYRLKCSPVVGNVAVALLSATVPILVIAAESQALIIPAGDRALELGGAYGLFALLATFFREGVKDLEDAAGDRMSGCSTLAVRRPYPARFLALASVVFLIGGLITFLGARGAGMVAWTVAGSFVMLPSVAAGLLLILARKPSEFSRISLIAKIIMLGGLALLPLIRP